MNAELYWIEEAPFALAILPRPRGGEYLDDEIASLSVQGVNVLVSLLTMAERNELGLTEEAGVCAARSVQFVSLPIEDRSVPAEHRPVRELVGRLRDALNQGRGVGIHCRMGIGRSAIIAAILLKTTGMSTGASLEMIGKARGHDVPDTKEQRAWVESFNYDIGG